MDGLNKPAPFAIRVLQRRPDGTMGVVYKDAQTGEVLQDISGYQVIDPGNKQSLEDLGIDPVKEDKNKKEETTADQVKQSIDLHEGSKDRGRSEGPAGQARSQANNFGYVDKPAALGVASAVMGGPFGTALGLANTGLNINNTMAADAARKSMGVEGLGALGMAKGALAGRSDGYVGDVKIGNQQYGVGFEAQDKFGRTMMTPNEARTRGLLAGDISLANPTEVKKEVDAFASSFPNAKKGNTIAGALAGNVSNMVGSVKGFFSSLFGDTPSAKPSGDAFPNAPGGTKNTTKGSLGDVIGYSPSDSSAKSAPDGGYSAKGGQDSPSESGGRFGGGGLGSPSSNKNESNKSSDGMGGRSDGWT